MVQANDQEIVSLNPEKLYCVECIIPIWRYVFKYWKQKWKVEKCVNAEVSLNKISFLVLKIKVASISIDFILHRTLDSLPYPRCCTPGCGQSLGWSTLGFCRAPGEFPCRRRTGWSDVACRAHKRRCSLTYKTKSKIVNCLV